jgi:hypothetical protein
MEAAFLVNVRPCQGQQKVFLKVVELQQQNIFQSSSAKSF